MTVLSSEADFCVHGAQMAAGGESSPKTIERTGRRKEKKLIKPWEDRLGIVSHNRPIIPKEEKPAGYREPQ